jgi:hypothetical protein
VDNINVENISSECKMDLREIGRMVWTGLIWLRKGTSGGLVASQEGFGSMELVIAMDCIHSNVTEENITQQNGDRVS